MLAFLRGAPSGLLDELRRWHLQRRFTWLRASPTTIHMASFEEGLGRIMFVAGALEHERPFLAPLYKFLTMHPRNAVRRVPPYVSFILRYLAGEISKKRSLGAQRKEKPGGKITARVLFDGTHGLSVNSRTRIRDQERAPIAADLKRTMREKAKVDELTFALSADVTEAGTYTSGRLASSWLPSYPWW